MSVSSSAPGSKFCVAICGAGIGGLVLAITIGKYDPSILIDLYEAHTSIDTPGVGITVWKKMHEVMVDLGLFDDFREIFTHSPESPKYRRSDIREGGYHWLQLEDRHGRSPMHRQQMITILEKHLPASCKVHFKKQLINYVELRQDTRPILPIKLEFVDGTVATADVLIGADGIHSVVRKTMFEAASRDGDIDEINLEQYVHATFTGIFVYRGLAPAKVLRKENPENIALEDMMGYSGKGRYLVTYPIEKGTAINIVAYIYDPNLTGTHYEGHWATDATSDELVEWFDNFEPDVRAVVKHCEKPSKWALHIVKPLPFCTRNRVALIGDACHAMTPHLGAGAGQAIDDAYVLGRLIAHPLTLHSRIQDALRIYEDIRLPIARSVADLSLSTGWMFAFMAPGYYDGRRNQVGQEDHDVGLCEKEGMETSKQEILRRWNTMDNLGSALQAWGDAELKLLALADQTANY